MPDIRVFTITGGAPREVTARDGRRFTFYDVYDDQGGKWQARQDTWNHAMGLIGQRVMAVTRAEQKGDFTNFFVDSVELMVEGGAMPQTQPVYQPVQQAQQAQAPPPQQQAPIVAPNERERQSSIHRQTATKVSAVLSKTPGEFWENVQTIFRFFETGQIPVVQASPSFGEPGNRPNAAAYAPGPGQAAYADPGPQEGQYATQGADDDIPFAPTLGPYGL